MKPVLMRHVDLFPGCRIRVNDKWLLVTHVEFTEPDRMIVQYGDMGIRTKPTITSLAIVPNARFWLWWGGDWVKLTVPYGETVRCYESHPTEEGYSFTSEDFEHEGFRVVRNHVSGGSDCDGPLSHYSESACLFRDLQSIPAESDEYGDNPPRADWQLLSKSQRDEYAEAAGY